VAVATDQLLRPDILTRIKDLELKAREIIHGMYQGMHRSPYFGAGIEYADHRSYSQGDEPRHIDWKLYFRTDKFFVKRYEIERDLTCRIFLDASRSMGFASEWGSKLDYAKLLAASLSHMIVAQRDMVGLTIFQESVSATVPPRSGKRHLRGLLALLTELEADGQTDMRNACIAAAQQSQRRGIAVIVSDFLDEPQSTLDGLGHLIARKQEVVCFHLLDRYERTFPYHYLGDFVDPETQRSTVADPVPVRQDYLSKLDAFITELREGCWKRNIDYVPLDTAESLAGALGGYLTQRLRRFSRRTGRKR